MLHDVLGSGKIAVGIIDFYLEPDLQIRCTWLENHEIFRREAQVNDFRCGAHDFLENGSDSYVCIHSYRLGNFS
jgi:hypothetical protein